ncbi:MAG: M28 family peptidase [Chloroflexota bacterium]|nr:M28 family peptidase [Chloroflexota bacterium]
MSRVQDRGHISRRQFIGAAVGTVALTGLALSPIVQGAVDSGMPAGSSVPPFDAERAYSYLLRQVEFGPREPGKRGHVECRDYLRAHLRETLGNSSLQPFEMETDRGAIPMWNILAEHDAENPRQVLLCAHWDTRPTADKEPDPEDRDQPIAGANDGASGVAVLLEVASLLRAYPPPYGVRFVLFDGEDYGPGSDRMYLGAKHYAQHLPTPDPEWGVLLDMVGDRDLGIWRERNSENGAPQVNDRIWRAAKAAGHSDVFHDSEKWSITDDHIPLLEAGVPIVDLIDFDYPYWHTLEDTPDKCSPESLGAVGETLLHALYQ